MIKEEKVFFEGEFGKICGVLNKVNKNKEIIIIVHGFSSNKYTLSAVNMCKRLNDINKNVFRIDLDNRGESDLEFTDAKISRYVSQVQKTIKYFKNQNYNKISLIGGSFGGVVSMEIAKLHPELYKVFLRCPGSGLYYKYLIKGKENEYEYVMKKGFFDREGVKFSIDIIKDLELYYPLTNIAKKIKIPVCVIHGDKDEVVNINETIEFCKEIKNCELTIIEGAGHNLGVDGDFSESLKVLTDFFRE